MEIAPIPGIRVLPVAKARPTETELTAAFEIESSACPHDDTYTSTRRKAAGAEESEDDLEVSLDDASSAEPETDPSDETPPRQISLFA